MPLDRSTLRALDDAEIAVREAHPLTRRTWWRAGGPADAWIDTANLETLCTIQRLARETGTPVFVMGNASNLLVSDRGIRGLVLKLTGELAQIRALEGPGPPVLEIGAGTLLTTVLRRAGRAGWTGLGAFAGIPGTVGGAVRMNAGASLGETVDTLREVDVVLATGEVETLSAEALRMSYRTAHLPPGSIIARARFATTGGDPEGDRAAIEHHLARRAATQPINQPSCGSTFRNPPGDHAGRLIEQCGLKGFTIEQAQVSEKHANFIVNLGGASADAIRSVLEHVERVVAEQTGIQLHREVHYAGDWSHWP